MAILVHGATHIGQKRKTNQDSIFLSRKHGFFAVADGMGGHRGGDIASKSAVELLKIYLDKYAGSFDPNSLLTSIIKKVNNKIHERSQKEPKLRGMGTTLNGVYFTKEKVYVVNIGDSRTYLINNGMFYQLSKDHSLVQEKLDLGFYTRDEARTDKMKNVLVRTLGFEADIDVDIYTYKPQRYDMFLTCSDGLHGKVSERDMLAILNSEISHPGAASQQEVDQVVHKLIDTANENGGDDNISVILSITQ